MATTNATMPMSAMRPTMAMMYRKIFFNLIPTVLRQSSMDDVHYLLENAREESYLFLVDSRRRDTSVHPTPSEYDITFAAPFRNVFGLDLLDATVARTEYIVDTNGNSLDYVMAQPTSLSDFESGSWKAGKRTVVLDPGDYNLPQFVEHLNDKLAARAAQAGEPPIKCAAVTNPSEISNKVVFTCSAPFAFLMATSTLRHTLGFGDPVTTTGSADYAAVPGWSVNKTGGASDTFLSLPASILDGDPGTATLGPVPAAPGEQTEHVHAGRTLRQHFTSLSSGPPTAVSVYAFGAAGCPGMTVRVLRASDDLEMAYGLLSGSDLVTNTVNDAYEPLTCATVAARVLEEGTEYVVELSCSGTQSQRAEVYFNQDNLPVAGTRYMEVQTDEDTAVVHVGFNACVDVATASWGHALRCPGIVNLTGPRYVSIRCPEIESHMFRDRVNERVHAGLGMVQLRGYGFREQRFDFVSFPARRFHPIGKLTKLTFRLERPDGTPYNSNGVDHALLLVLRHYSLPRAPRLEASTLNPNYVPDYKEYMITQKWAEELDARNAVLDKRF